MAHDDLGPMPERQHFYLAATIDLDRAVTWLVDANAQRPASRRLLMAALFLKAVAGSLLDIPELNGFWIDGRGQTSAGVHLGIALATRRAGPVIPVLVDADRRDLDDLTQALLAMVRRFRAGHPDRSDLGHPTFTVTSLGELGVHAVFSSIVPPQVGSVGFGKVVEQPSVVAGAIVCSPVVTATLAADHRAVDGRRGARFLAAIERRLQAPEAL
jgi:pyruvate dehydrogenase E2 component (dihydrolipoyllysine-residue acetyltransferase)